MGQFAIHMPVDTLVLLLIRHGILRVWFHLFLRMTSQSHSLGRCRTVGFLLAQITHSLYGLLKGRREQPFDFVQAKQRTATHRARDRFRVGCLYNGDITLFTKQRLFLFLLFLALLLGLQLTGSLFILRRTAHMGSQKIGVVKIHGFHHTYHTLYLRGHLIGIATEQLTTGSIILKPERFLYERTAVGKRLHHVKATLKLRKQFAGHALLLNLRQNGGIPLLKVGQPGSTLLLRHLIE